MWVPVDRMTPKSPGRYRVLVQDGGPFPEKVVYWDGRSWKNIRGWPAYGYLKKYIRYWTYVD